MTKFFQAVRVPLLLTLALMLICGLVYPLLMTGLGQLMFPRQANGSMVEYGGRVVGSQLVGQDFTDARFMKCRPSAVGYNTYTQAAKDAGDYAGVSSGSKNYAPSNPDLVARVEQDMANFLAANPAMNQANIPTDILTASGSGLDPHISPAAAQVQIPALALATGLTEQQLEEIVRANTQGRWLGIFGEETVNVLMVNLDIARALNII